MVDAVVTVFLEKLLNVLTEESRYLSQHRQQFEKLKNELLFMQSFLKDAERLKRKHITLKAVMACLRDLIFEAEEILEDCQNQSADSDGATRFSMRFHPKRLSLRHQTGKRLAEINDKISEIKQNISTYLGVPLMKEGSMEAHDNLMTRWTSSLYDHTQVVGLEGDRRR